ncbi:MAG: hypothetical protein M5U31_11575 [Acidimicrobiia bacterium]|nr:hypothetical protein [Acidimicrobiia bacterium]
MSARHRVPPRGLPRDGVRRAAPRRADPDDERGIALVTVVLTTLILSLVATAAVGYGIGSQNLSRRDQDWNAALAAAEAGIDDYLLRLNQNNNYWLTTDPENDAMNGGWAQIPGGSAEAEFQYEADGSGVASSGTVALTSTGRVRGVERTVEATLRKRSFLDYLYFTDFETLDPVAYSGNPSPAWAQTNCSKYWYQGRKESGPGYDCVNIRFGGNDVINGPLHSNDAILIRGAPSSWATPPRVGMIPGVSSGVMTTPSAHRSSPTRAIRPLRRRSRCPRATPRCGPRPTPTSEVRDVSSRDPRASR